MWLPQGGALKIENLTVYTVQYYNATLFNTISSQQYYLPFRVKELSIFINYCHLSNAFLLSSLTLIFII